MTYITEPDSDLEVRHLRALLATTGGLAGMIIYPYFAEKCVWMPGLL